MENFIFCAVTFNKYLEEFLYPFKHALDRVLVITVAQLQIKGGFEFPPPLIKF